MLPDPPLTETEHNSGVWVKVFPDHDCRAHLPDANECVLESMALCECGRVYITRRFFGVSHWSWTLT